jgi:hypothetical protein
LFPIACHKQIIKNWFVLADNKYYNTILNRFQNFIEYALLKNKYETT